MKQVVEGGHNVQPQTGGESGQGANLGARGIRVVQDTPSYLEQQVHEAEARMQSWTARFAPFASDLDARDRLLLALDKAREVITDAK